MRSLWQKCNLYFSSAAPQGLTCRVSVLESALHEAIQANSWKEAPIPSNKFQTGIPFLSILQEGLESPKQLYKNFRLTTLSEVLSPSHLSTPLPFIYSLFSRGSSVRPPASPSGGSSEPCPCFASSEVWHSGCLGSQLCDFSWRRWSANPATAALPLVCQHGGTRGYIFQAVSPRLGFSLVPQTWSSSSGRPVDKSVVSLWLSKWLL